MATDAVGVLLLPMLPVVLLLMFFLLMLVNPLNKLLLALSLLTPTKKS